MQTVASYSKALLMELPPDRAPPGFTFERHVQRDKGGPLRMAVRVDADRGRRGEQKNVPGFGGVNSRTRVGGSRDPCPWSGLPAGDRSAGASLDPPSYAGPSHDTPSGSQIVATNQTPRATLVRNRERPNYFWALRM